MFARKTLLSVVSFVLFSVYCQVGTAAPKNQKKKVAAASPSSLKNIENTEYTPTLKRIDFIAGKDKNKRYYPRAKAIQKLKNNLSPREVAAIYEFLNKKMSQESLKPLEFNSLKNDLVLVLMTQQRKPSQLGYKLSEMYNNKKFCSIWRDYCIQFMGRWYKEASPDEQKLMLKDMFAATDEGKNGIAGAALIALNSNVGMSGISPKEVREAAFKVAENKETPDYVKLTAIQICAMRNDKRVLPIAREIVKTGKYVPLKMSAIAAIGFLGNSNDMDDMKELSRSTDVRIRSAATAALRKLSKPN